MRKSKKYENWDEPCTLGPFMGVFVKACGGIKEAVEVWRELTPRREEYFPKRKKKNAY
jgi:hypothetical protein